MARRRTHGSTLRNRVVSIRLTDDEYAKRASEARHAGLTMSSLCEQLVNKGRVEAAPASTRMDPALFVALSRIGNNANQIAHALNSNLPADVQMAWRTASDLLKLLAREELLAQQKARTRPPPAKREDDKAFIQQLAEALDPRTPVNDSPAPQTRDIFQRSVQVHPARRGQGQQ